MATVTSSTRVTVYPDTGPNNASCDITVFSYRREGGNPINYLDM